MTQNVPPKPQQTSASGSSFRLSPATVFSSRRGWLLDAELAQPRAGIVVGDAAAMRRLHRSDAEDVGQEAHQLEGFFGERCGARAPTGIVGEAGPDSAS